MRRHPGADDLAAYSIGGLDPRGERSLERHLRRCESCTGLLRERYAPAVAVLAESVEQHEPPARLRRSLLATVQAEASAQDPLRTPEGAPPGPRRAREEAPAAGPRRAEPAGRGRRRAGAAAALLRPAAGLAALSLLAAAGIGYLLAGGGGEPAETIALPRASSGMEGELVVADGSATLHVRGAEPLADPGAVYQVWVAGPSGVEPSAAFVPHEDGTATAAVPEAAGDATAVMITREPRPGLSAPSAEPIVDLRLG